MLTHTHLHSVTSLRVAQSGQGSICFLSHLHETARLSKEITVVATAGASVRTVGAVRAVTSAVVKAVAGATVHGVAATRLRAVGTYTM